MRWIGHSRLRPLAGVALAGLLASSMTAALSAANVELKRGPDQVEVYIGGQLFTTYYFSAAVAKPYLMPQRTPAGVILSRDFPVGNGVGKANPRESTPNGWPAYNARARVMSRRAKSAYRPQERRSLASASVERAIERERMPK